MLNPYENMHKKGGLKYLFIGAGAIGGCMGAYLADYGCDVTFIAHERTVNAIKENGIRVFSPRVDITCKNVKAELEENYHDKPDIIFITVKNYSIDSIIPFLDRICDESTIVLPLNNALDMGSRIEKKMKTKTNIIGGVAYVAVVQDAPGVIRQKMNFYRVNYGPRPGHPLTPEMNTKLIKMRFDMLNTGMCAYYEEDAIFCCLRKFIRVSPMSAASCYFDTDFGTIRNTPEMIKFYRGLVDELFQIAAARGTPFGEEAVIDYEDCIETCPAGYQTSIRHDMLDGKPMEVDTMFFDVYEMGRSLGLEMPCYGAVSRHFGYKGDM